MHRFCSAITWRWIHTRDLHEAGRDFAAFAAADHAETNPTGDTLVVAPLVRAIVRAIMGPHAKIARR